MNNVGPNGRSILTSSAGLQIGFAARDIDEAGSFTHNNADGLPSQTNAPDRDVQGPENAPEMRGGFQQTRDDAVQKQEADLSKTEAQRRDEITRPVMTRRAHKLGRSSARNGVQRSTEKASNNDYDCLDQINSLDFFRKPLSVCYIGLQIGLDLSCNIQKQQLRSRYCGNSCVKTGWP